MAADGCDDWLRAFARDRDCSSLPPVEVISSTFECFEQQRKTGLGGDDAEILHLLLQFLRDASDNIRDSPLLRRWILTSWPDTSTDLSSSMFFGRSDLHKKRGSFNGTGSKRKRREIVEGSELVGPIKGFTCEWGRGRFLSLSAAPGSKKPPHTYKCDRCKGCPRRHLHISFLKHENVADGDWALYQIGDFLLPPTIPHSLLSSLSSPPAFSTTAAATSIPASLPTSLPTSAAVQVASPPSGTAPPPPSSEALAASSTPQLGYPHPSNYPLHPALGLLTSTLPYPPSTHPTANPSAPLLTSDSITLMAALRAEELSGHLDKPLASFASADTCSFASADASGFAPADTCDFAPADACDFTSGDTCSFAPADTCGFTSGDTCGDSDTLELVDGPEAIDLELALNDGAGLAAGYADDGGLAGLLSGLEGADEAGWDQLPSDDENDRAGGMLLAPPAGGVYDSLQPVCSWEAVPWSPCCADSALDGSNGGSPC